MTEAIVAVMPEFHLQKYSSCRKTQWDNFVKNSPNTSFLFQRDYMEYHRDRFTDCSLLIFKGKKLVALLPGHKDKGRFCSHLGLSYGGFIYAKKQKVTQLEEIFTVTLHFLRAEGFQQFLLKRMPAIYQELYSSAIDYFFFQSQAELLRRDLNFVVDLQRPFSIHRSKRRIMQKDYTAELHIEETTEVREFWEDVLQPVLRKKHNADPVHSLDEISHLKQRFSKNIRQFNVYKAQKLIAGLTLFITNGVVKSQYGAATALGEKYRALDYLYLQLFEQFKAEKYRYFDLGTTNNKDSKTYKHGLTDYKEELGAHPVNQDLYALSL